MNFLSTYLRPYRKILVLVLVLASVNQIFSLMSPQVLRRLIDNYLTKVGSIEFTTQQYVYGIFLGL
jgi:ATP-binding cassette subfamily B protein